MTAAASQSWSNYRPAQRWGYLGILFLVCLSNYVDRHVMSVLIEPIKAEFKVSDAMMGILTGFAFAAFYAVLGVPIARLADRGDRRTVITVSLVIWSAMTMLCGFARSFWVLALGRTGVGAGEAGSIPPAQSLIADYFPPQERTRALGIFMSASTAGYLIAFIAGAWIAEIYGWRAAFLALGAPGLALAAITFFGLNEPRRGAGAASANTSQESLNETLKALFSKLSYVWLCVAMVSYFLVAYGVVTWFPAYMGRVMHLKLSAVGGLYGSVTAVSALLGTLGGGWLTDVLAERDIRWLAWSPAIALIAMLPIYEFALSSNDLTRFMIAAFITGTALSGSIPALFSVLHAVCGSARRAMAVAVVFFLANLIGLGFGPLITGALSDQFTAQLGPVGLRYALMTALIALIPCSFSLWMCSRFMGADTEP